MSKRALWNVPHVRVSLILMALAASLVLAGCGGGGGGGTPSTPSGPASSPTLAIVTGRVTDTTAAATPVPGAVVSIANTSLKSSPTAADGTFSIPNVPVGTVGLSVAVPTGGQYLGYVLYNSKQYDTQACPIQITTKASGASKTPTALAANLQLYPAAAGPPAPPLTGADGCPR